MKILVYERKKPKTDSDRPIDGATSPQDTSQLSHLVRAVPHPPEKKRKEKWPYSSVRGKWMGGDLANQIMDAQTKKSEEVSELDN